MVRQHISIHALREEGDRLQSGAATGHHAFLSTPSARRATWGRYKGRLSVWNFYPRPPRGGRLVHPVYCTGRKHFYPRPPRGGRLLLRKQAADRRPISIHALREEGDVLPDTAPSERYIFLSTPSARRATQKSRLAGDHSRFLSTPSARRATTAHRHSYCVCDISIHALREEGDAIGCIGGNVDINFYPRPPRGGRLLLTPPG